MRSVIISNYSLIREGLFSIVSKFNNMKINLAAENFSQAVSVIKENETDIVFLDLHKYNVEELKYIKELKQLGIKSRFIIIDFNDNRELFVNAIKCGVEGYITGKCTEIEILQIIDRIYRGKKYFDAGFIDSMINEEHIEPQNIDQLTIREKEILLEIANGLSNRMISEKLFISEHTVKKHINHIFDKLNIRDRTQLAIYAKDCGVAKRDVS